jgi:hypothetical protein
MVMKKLILVAIIILGTVAYVGADEIRFDGNFWNKSDKTVKEFFISGILGGIIAGQDRVTASAMEGVEKGQVDMKCFAAISSLKNSLEADMGKIEVEQIVDGIDAFYSDLKNRSIKVKWAFLVVWQQIKGTPEEEIKKFIESVRQNHD